MGDVMPAKDELPGNLPAQQSSFVGRGREITELVGLLGDARLVTLAGVGGVGKTRLALQVAAEVSPSFRHGTWLVELARVRDPAVVEDAVAAVFGVSRREGVEDTLAGFLRPRELLVVLDNCEHLLSSVVALVRALEGSCPKLVVLATSREGLGIAGERLVAVAPLDLPRSGDRDAVLHSDAARLFIDRAIAVKSDFAVTDSNATSIADVVQRLDGIPLALELAAARVPVLSPLQLAQRLDQRFRLLSGGERGAIERHATLRAAIDWSYELLDHDQQWLLARLSVFAGGCSLEAVECVCSGGGIDEGDVLGLLAGLVARSLVVVDETPWEQRRYRLLETIRQYAEEQVKAAESTELRDRHARFYADFIEAVARGLRGHDQLRWLQQSEPELENLRTAMAWTVANDEAVYAERFLVAAAEIERGPLAAGLLRLADDVLAMPSVSTDPRYPFTLMAGAMAALFRGSYDRAEQLCTQALAAAAEPNDELEGRTAFVRAVIARYADQGHAIEHQERAVRHIRGLGRPDLLVRTLDVLAAFRQEADMSTGREEAQEALAVARATGNPGLISCALGGLAYVLAYSEPERSRVLIAESLELNDSLGTVVVDELALILTIMAIAMLGDHDQLLIVSARALDCGFTATSRLSACLLCVADALATETPHAAAVLQGHVDMIAPGLARAEPHRTFRRRTAAAIDARLDATRINELRAQGASLAQTQAAAYALDAIARLLSDAESRALQTQKPALRRRGATWDISYRTEAATAVDSKGLRDLAVLLSRPGVEVHVLELARSSVDSGASIEMVDRSALAQYRRRLTDLDEDRAEAERHHDTERNARVEAEREALLRELRTVRGLGGQPRSPA
jgi:predicted ATPase